MLEIRQQQVDVLEKAALKKFEDEMVEHLCEFAPRHCEVIREPAVRQVIRLGIALAQSYGMTSRGPMRFYIEMMFVLGSAFDTDPQFEWAGETLRDNILAESSRAETLYAKLMDYLDKVAGPANEFALRALRETSILAKQPLTFASKGFEGVMLAEMKRIYPQKCAYVGAAPLKALIQEATSGAQLVGFAMPQSMALFVVLMFAMGHGFAYDPLFPWVSRTLTDPRVADPERRAQRLQNKAVTYLDFILANIDQATHDV